jgi:hypothetical protein
MYVIEERVFLVCLYWVTGSLKQCQAAFRNRFHLAAQSKKIFSIRSENWRLKESYILSTVEVSLQ